MTTKSKRMKLRSECECAECKAFREGSKAGRKKNRRGRVQVIDPFWNRFQDRRTDRGD